MGRSEIVIFTIVTLLFCYKSVNADTFNFNINVSEEADDPVEAAKPAKANKLVRAEKPVKAEKPVQVNRLVNANKPVQAGNPVKANQLVRPDKLVRANQPVQANKLVKPYAPVKSDKLVKPYAPVKSDKLVKPYAPVKSDKLVKVDKAVKVTGADEADEVEEAEKPVDEEFAENGATTENAVYEEDIDLNATIISRSYFGPDDPWAVDRCPKRKHKETVLLDWPEDCTKYQKCWWISSKGKELDTLVVHLVSCLNCPEPECPGGKMVFMHDAQKCFPPNQLLKSVNECGTKEPPANECKDYPSRHDVHRLGKSRFHVIQSEDASNWVNWKGAKEACAKLDLKLAKIDDLQTDIYVGRLLEDFIKPLGWIHNWYWLDAKFDREKMTYVWQDTSEPIKFSNFFYRAGRPKGYGDFMDNDGNYLSNPEVGYCLAISMPRDFPKHGDGLIQLPMHTSWWERECHHTKKGNVLCESTDPVCEEERAEYLTAGPFTDETGYYFDDFWPISNRRFVVKWTAKSQKEAKELCESHNMVLYSPSDDDSCLKNDLKPWMKSITSYSFWTDAKYFISKKNNFEYPDQKPIAEALWNITTYPDADRRKREAVKDDTGVSYTWNHEIWPRNINFCECTITSLELSPENFNNPIGVICQHPEEQRAKMKCRDTPLTDKYMEYYPFEKASNILRSAYKQSGGNGRCPPGYKRAGRDLVYWRAEDEFESSTYQYDYLSSYWLEPENGTCLLSKLTYNYNEKTFTRAIQEGNCEKILGFLLCMELPQGAAAVGTRGGPARGSFVAPAELDEI